MLNQLHLYSFERIDKDLAFVPLAARRALDLCGMKLSLEAWRTLSKQQRGELMLAGLEDAVDVERVRSVVRQSAQSPVYRPPASDPDPAAPPVDLVEALGPARPLDAGRWRELRTVDRYALVAVYMRARQRQDPAYLARAYDAIVLEPPPPPSPRPTSSHVDGKGEVRMIDVAPKEFTHRRAVARGSVTLGSRALAALTQGAAPKGDVLATARIAGIQAAKRTWELIPLCHPVQLTSTAVDVLVDAAASRVLVTATAQAVERTGVEMEAMVAASVACLTVYDMLKGIDREITISGVQLLEKSGGQSGDYRRSK